ncbi:MAG: SusC/RagA family TonB-linked outer membrane protein [Phocaeicola sp.]
MNKFIAFLILISSVATSFAQQTKTIRGVVIDELNDPVIGATVQVVGTPIGTVTDLDGQFILENVLENSTLVFSFIGLESKELKLAGQYELKVTLTEDTQRLDDIVVIGYGAAKSKDLTSPISVVKGDEILNQATSSPMAALQGKVAGVNVTNSGSPGSGPKVTIRGVGSFSNTSPLYVVDGMFYDNIDFLNNADIQEMSILKDASAAAIYGVRAANGVVIITTKKGKVGQKAQITYNGYFGVQQASNVLEMANSQQYATMMLEANSEAYTPMLQASINQFGGDFNTLTFHADTDWYKELLRTAAMTNHSIGVSGGGEKATYSLGMSYLYQDGIMDVKNNYDRLNFRASVDFDATNWLKVGFNGIFSNANQVVANNSAWQNAFNMPSIMPVYDEKRGDHVFPTKYASPDQILLTSNFYNPVATADYHDSVNKTYKVLSNFYAQFNLLPEKLNFRTSYSYDYSQTQGRSFIAPYYVSSWQQRPVSELTKTNSTYYNYIWDNILTYNEVFGMHKMGVMAGYSMREENYRYISGTASNVPAGADEWLYLSQGNSDGIKLSDNGHTYRGQSFFARLNYDYDGKYLLMFTMRADGTSKYQETWGYFPSVGAAWVVSQENFMKNQSVIDYLKVRASWGKLGNDHVAASDGFASITTGQGASGVFGDVLVPGFQNTSYYSWLKWEVVDEANVGFNLTTLQNRLSLDFDYFHRLTKNAIISPRIPFDNNTLAGNYGEILNAGFDFQANWSDKITKDLRYTIGANVSYLHNEVKKLNGLPYILGGKTINMVGEQMNSYYGYKVVGIYQNEAECAADPVAVANGLIPGDFKYEDINGDNVIDGNDRQILGSYIPAFTFSLNLGLSYKNFDAGISLYAQTGAEMYNRKRALRYAQSNFNFDKNQYDNRWTGEGTTNSHPSSAALIKGWNVGNTNSYFVEDGSYFRIQNINLGYSFKNIKMGSYTMPNIRLSATADRPFTTFKANSFTPELTDAEGWDTEVYPLTSTYTLGVQIDF